MNVIILLSVILKGVGALLEIVLQITITRTLGISGYGEYTTWINLADLIIWCLFSGLIKLNTFYLSEKGVTIRKFKTGYYLRYVIPVIIALVVYSCFTSSSPFFAMSLILLAETLMLDRSSSLLAKGKYVKSLLGEYLVGRMFLLISVFILFKFQKLTLDNLILAYLVQYILVVLMFVFSGKESVKKDISEQVSLKKWWQYQRSDILSAIIGHMPVILQYLFVGSFEAGLVSIVLLVKKLINFISGPTAKIFLPEFSRLYHANKIDEIRSSFSSIIRIQMIFVGPLAVALLGYPKVVLKIMANELMAYTSLFMCCAVVFIIATTLGPSGGLMQMTGNEKKENRYREITIVAMFLVLILLREDPLFVLYGLCTQTFVESVSKYCFVCRWLGKAPISLKKYVKEWLLPVIVIAITYVCQWQDSILMMIMMAGLTFSVTFFKEIKRKNGIVELLIKKMQR